MPIKGYFCCKCKHEYEVFYSSQSAVAKEERAEKCPQCGSRKKTKAPPTRTSFQLKGKGWFKDGY
jgi:predicted nucleic acid-binding Zn ribbon protein